MRRVQAILATAIAFSLSSCVLSKKPQTVAAAPAPPKPVSLPAPEPPRTGLSDTQTQVELPPPQPLNLEAIASNEPEKTPAVSAPRNDRPSRGRGGQSTTSAAQSGLVGPPVPIAATAPAATESERPPIQEILSPGELRRFQDDAVRNRQEIRQKLQQLGRRRLSTKEQEMKDQAQSFSRQSDDAQKSGDMRKAFELSARGVVLAKALVEGK